MDFSIKRLTVHFHIKKNMGWIPQPKTTIKCKTLNRKSEITPNFAIPKQHQHGQGNASPEIPSTENSMNKFKTKYTSFLAEMCVARAYPSTCRKIYAEYETYHSCVEVIGAKARSTLGVISLNWVRHANWIFVRRSLVWGFLLRGRVYDFSRQRLKIWWETLAEIFNDALNRRSVKFAKIILETYSEVEIPFYRMFEGLF